MENAAKADQAALTIGTAVYHPAYGKTGYVAEIENIAGSNIYTLGTGKPVKQNSQLSIVWDDESWCQVSEGIAETWLAAARRQDIAPALNAPELLAGAKARQMERVAAAAADREKAKQDRAAFIEMIRPKIPAGTKAVICAELVEDKSDIMTDYFGSTTTRTVILAFSSHTRDLFPEMRKAAGNFAETAHLVDAPEKAEHREKWSMGGGYYLKDGYRHDSGWKVCKHTLYGDDPAAGVPVGELALAQPEAVAAKAETEVTGSAAFTVSDHIHTKGGFRMWIATPAERVERDEFDSMLARAKSGGGWYSRAWGKTPGGFAFKSAEAAAEFVGGTIEAKPEGKDSAPAAALPAIGDKLRTLADNLQGEIDSKLADRLTNTPKRQRQAASARLDGEQLQRAQAGLRALAALHDAGTVPADLQGVRTKAAAVDLARSKIEHSGAYYDAGRCTGQPAKSTPAALAFWQLLKPKSAEELAADKVRHLLAEIALSKIPGYFPTPAGIVADMLAAADLAPGAHVLEPSAGSGAILDAVRAACPSAKLAAYEVNGRLREVLQAKGYDLAGWDFTESDPGPIYDAAIMNPPFENGQDVQHVRQAFDQIKPGGCLVSIMAPGFQFNTARKFGEFREWLAGQDYECRSIPAGAFKESGTGVASVMVTIRKGA